MKIFEIIGWCGVLLILLGYGLTTFSIITPDNIWFGIINLLGAAGIMTSSYVKRDIQPVALNAVWFLIAAIAIIRTVIA